MCASKRERSALSSSTDSSAVQCSVSVRVRQLASDDMSRPLTSSWDESPQQEVAGRPDETEGLEGVDGKKYARFRSRW